MLLATICVVLLALCWLLTVLPFIRVYSAWVGGHPIYAAEVAIVLLMLLGALGSGFGVSNLFWHEDWWVQACRWCQCGRSGVVLLVVERGCLSRP